ncbi:MULTISPECIES: glycosyltransferase [unclassified Rhizobium]|uniref:glycosyltransferase family 8 protein n=1 Tax=unclassified Rhizobium TaxID=2613769 RepID=UPI001C837B34|nr:MULTISPECIES: glycosyltransferase [unclassified Rhizobium]MBX5218798.1 glycosyl transferase [Rhizobium sp. NLR8a]MBX5235940.1 glycosyl transferase [Rhizobium sp. NLR4a]MBX5241427.1 glycosyl transferase [Rhizobium sp. NLR22b]
MNNQCVVYVTDVEYSFPTILSALQARKFASPASDVCVLMSERLDNFNELRALLTASGVELVDATDALQDSLGKLDPSHFRGRISVSTMAKLVLCEILPAHYSQIIYLDGDTQIVSDLGKLENATVPEGRFFAARDYTAIQDFLNTGKDNHYFNAGVLKFHRNGWIGQEALELFASNPEACEGKHDQGALNYVRGSSLILVSNRWNFPKQFLHLVNMSSLAIVHYMAHPKPWHGTFFPWTDRESQVYVDLRKAHPIYNALYRGISFDRKMLYKYRSMRARIEHAIERNGPHPRVQSLLVGDYAV